VVSQYRKALSHQLIHMDFEDFGPNLRRSVKAKEFPVEKKYRIKTKTRLAKFKDMQDRLDDRQGKYSDQATFQFMLELAHAKLQELDSKDQEIQDLSSEV